MRVPQSLSERAVLVDTSAFYARLDQSDQWHQEATKGFDLLAQERRPLFTTNLVVGETFALTLRRLGSPIAMQWLEALGTFNLVFQKEEHHPSVVDLLRRYPAAAFSYVDVFSLLTMEEIGIPAAFTFDRQFQRQGWRVFPHP